MSSEREVQRTSRPFLGPAQLSQGLPALSPHGLCFALTTIHTAPIQRNTYKEKLAQYIVHSAIYTKKKYATQYLKKKKVRAGRGGAQRGDLHKWSPAGTGGVAGAAEHRSGHRLDLADTASTNASTPATTWRSAAPAVPWCTLPLRETPASAADASAMGRVGSAAQRKCNTGWARASSGPQWAPGNAAGWCTPGAPELRITDPIKNGICALEMSFALDNNLENFQHSGSQALLLVAS
ncbi:hypothetical protein GGX14DRAFT_391228 [Mycena pura]|uniref:Uncharacterized protein n=1 Tax=Mycena pura TaxID=153505 RepID=A0AAD6YGT3_9AGAR|nr:hypothetical protein GGX14DRAFT_391228 [Mycena pura]